MSERAEFCVLVVDDDADTTDTTVILLSNSGFRALAAYDAEHALKVAETFRPRVVLLDLAMPRFDGYRLARDLRQLPGMGDAILIAISGYGTEADRRQSCAAGCDHHFLKPVDWDEMIAFLTSIS